jgi:hypothetical protein
MDERSTQLGSTERPIAAPDGAAGAHGPAHLADPRALTILTTEHWSMLTARSLVYNEAFTRAAMFLTFLTGTLVALGFLSQGLGNTREFLAVATAMLGFDLAIGLVTLGRVMSASGEDLRAIQAMNRLRHAYLEMVPSLEPYFSTSWHDDLAGVLASYGPPADRGTFVGEIAHGLSTIPAMVGMITAAVAGAFAAALVLLLDASPTLGIAVGVGVFVLVVILINIAAYRMFRAISRQIDARFPSAKG